MEEVKNKKKRILITKRGKAIAEVIPVDDQDKDIPLKDTVTFMGDIIPPVSENDWEVLK